ncbi:MAG: hypothetical protein CFE46_05235 [Burkholderiales bacterium PBB6]|nr:MAG: hypothetical protein CFE46_05235 [Burkholderiales bacterium PBB6]
MAGCHPRCAPLLNSLLSRRALRLAAVPLLIALALWGASIWAQQRLATAVRDALGPRASVGSIEVASFGITVRQLRVAAVPGWPAEEELSAEAVHIRPSWRSVLGGSWRLARVKVEGARLVMLRNRQGKLLVVPGLMAKTSATASATTSATASATASAKATLPPEPAAASGTRLVIDRIDIVDGRLDLFDDSFRPALPKPHHLTFAEVQATLKHLTLTALDEPMQIDMAAKVLGAGRDGQLRLSGDLTPASLDADLDIALQDVDMRLLQPWLLKAADGGVRAGRLDLQLQARVAGRRLEAPGRITLTGLQLASGPGLWNQVGGVSRDAALATLSRDGRIQLDFTLQGRLDDPTFSLNDSLAKRFATGLAEAVGVSVGGVVEGVGRTVRSLFGR